MRNVVLKERPLDSLKTRTTTTTRFVLTRDPSSFCRENLIVVVIHSTTRFCKKVVVAETSYQILEVLSF